MVNSVSTDISMPHPDFAAALSCVCQAINWDYGEVWIPNPETTLLELSPFWYCHPNRSSDRLDALEKFRACSEKFVLSIDEGLPGRIWRSRQPEWVNDVSTQPEDYFSSQPNCESVQRQSWIWISSCLRSSDHRNLCLFHRLRL
jgi:hypothetical protein